MNIFGSRPNGLYSRLYYSFQKYISIHYDITITLNTSGLGLALGLFGDVTYGISSYYYAVQLYWNGLVP